MTCALARGKRQDRSCIGSGIRRPHLCDVSHRRGRICSQTHVSKGFNAHAVWGRVLSTMSSGANGELCRHPIICKYPIGSRDAKSHDSNQATRRVGCSDRISPCPLQLGPDTRTYPGANGSGIYIDTIVTDRDRSTVIIVSASHPIDLSNVKGQLGYS